MFFFINSWSSNVKGIINKQNFFTKQKVKPNISEKSIKAPKISRVEKEKIGPPEVGHHKVSSYVFLITSKYTDVERTMKKQNFFTKQKDKPNISKESIRVPKISRVEKQKIGPSEARHRKVSSYVFFLLILAES